jgi:hypothetical protein
MVTSIRVPAGDPSFFRLSASEDCRSGFLGGGSQQENRRSYSAPEPTCVEPLCAQSFGKHKPKDAKVGQPNRGAQDQDDIRKKAARSTELPISGRQIELEAQNQNRAGYNYADGNL